MKENGERIGREKGTPQGGVVSPVLSNLYLHEAFDKWMKEELPRVKFERYADDIIIHCMSERQAIVIMDRVKQRFVEYKLEVHSDKSRVVYTGRDDSKNHRGHNMPRKFTFLGYDFKPRKYNGKIVFTPGMGAGALLLIGKKLRIESMMHGTLEEVAEVLNQRTRGWIEYYGKVRPSELYKMASVIDKKLVKWLGKKHKVSTHGKKWDMLKAIKERTPRLFDHWYKIKLLTRRAV